MQFFKYHGAGNDFIIIDNRYGHLTNFGPEVISTLCDRHFGIGADGLMLLQNHDHLDFEMIYFNSDGNEGSMCGNGGRCIVAFAHSLELIESEARFMAVDGEHKAIVRNNEYIKLSMKDVTDIETGNDYYYMDTGSPHYIVFTEELSVKDVFQEGKAIRYNDRFREHGTNVDFIERTNAGLFVRTYERGVENETLACGTGIVASALAAALEDGLSGGSYDIIARGGKLKVNFKKAGGTFTDIWLEGPVRQVFKGDIDLEGLLNR